jgi:hypothetical protein
MAAARRRGKFPDGKWLLHSAGANSQLGNACCTAQEQISRAQRAAAGCRDKFHARKELLQGAGTNFTRAKRHKTKKQVLLKSICFCFF